MKKAQSLEDILDVICVGNPLSALGEYSWGQGMTVDKKSNFVAELKLSLTGCITRFGGQMDENDPIDVLYTISNAADKLAQMAADEIAKCFCWEDWDDYRVYRIGEMHGVAQVHCLSRFGFEFICTASWGRPVEPKKFVSDKFAISIQFFRCEIGWEKLGISV